MELNLVANRAPNVCPDRDKLWEDHGISRLSVRKGFPAATPLTGPIIAASLCQNVLHDFSVHIGQAEIPTLETIREPEMIDPE